MKNTFIFAPVFFAGKITEIDFILSTSIAFITFSIASSSVYVLNDYLDIKSDRLHAEKKKRPLASGYFTKKQGILISLSLLFLSFFSGLFLSFNSMSLILFYILLNTAYSLYLKHFAVIDVTVIAIGFVLRLALGSAVTDIPLSSWIVVMTFLLALFLALAKRRDDILIYQETGKKMRKVVDGYNLRVLDATMAVMASVVAVSYVTYTTSHEVVNRIGSEYLYTTSLFVIVGIMRYLQIIYAYNDSGSPTRVIFEDRFIQLTLLSWLATFSLVIYL